MFNKKGALELSINAIIVIVIAFVFLGLGLSFIQTQIRDVESSTTAIQSAIHDQIMDQLREANRRLAFPTSDLTLSTSERTVQAVGIKNTGDLPGRFKVEFQVRVGDKFESGKMMNFESEDVNFRSSMLWDDFEQQLDAQATNLIRVELTAPNREGSYLYRIVMYEIKEGEDDKIYDTANFFVRT